MDAYVPGVLSAKLRSRWSVLLASVCNRWLVCGVSVAEPYDGQSSNEAGGNSVPAVLTRGLRKRTSHFPRACRPRRGRIVSWSSDCWSLLHHLVAGINSRTIATGRRLNRQLDAISPQTYRLCARIYFRTFFSAYCHQD